MDNPILKKEQKVRTRSPRLMLLVAGYNLGLMVLLILAFFMIYGAKPEVGMARYQDTLTLYVLMGVFQFALLLLIVPTLTASAITGEKERQTFDILMIANKKPGAIIIGKLSASVNMILLLIVSSLPILAIVFSVGGVSIIDIVMYVVVCLLEAVFVGSIGLFFSSISKTTVRATIASYATVLLLVIGTVLVLGMPCLTNPLITLIALLMEQTGNGGLFAQYMNRAGRCNAFVLEYWVIISVVVQMMIGGVLLRVSTRNIDRIKK